MWRKLVPFVFILSLVTNLVGLIFIGAKALNQPDESDVCSQKSSCSESCSIYESIGADVSCREAMELLKEQFGRERCRICCEIDTASQALMDAVGAEELDYTLIQSKKDRIIELQREMQDLVVDQIIKEKDLLPVELQQKFIGALRGECRSSTGAIASVGAAGRSCQDK